MNIWKSRIDSVLSDPEKIKMAAMLYWLIDSHLQNCLHKRQCSEQLLWTEAIQSVGFADNYKEPKGDSI